jgi:hypothetical protein
MPQIISKKNRVVYVGVDPGKSGGMAVSCDGLVLVRKMPETEKDVLEYFRGLVNFGPAVVAVEKVGGFIQDTPTPGSAMFNFGWNYGSLRMAILANDWPITESVAPQTWQKALSIAPKRRNETKTQWKNRLKARAQELFPTINVTLAVADALLIMEYVKRKHQR